MGWGDAPSPKPALSLTRRLAGTPALLSGPHYKVSSWPPRSLVPSFPVERPSAGGGGAWTGQKRPASGWEVAGPLCSRPPSSGLRPPPSRLCRRVRIQERICAEDISHCPPTACWLSHREGITPAAQDISVWASACPHGGEGLASPPPGAREASSCPEASSGLTHG